MTELHYDKNLDLFWFAQGEWSQSVFGSDRERGPRGPLLHLAKEVQEALANPDDLEEYADLIFLAFDSCRRAGFTYDELVDKCFEKLEKNKKRKWSKPVTDEPVEHVRDGGEQ